MLTAPYAEVIGDPVAHSKSPLIHRFWLDRLGLAGDFRTAHLARDQLQSYLQSRRRDADWRGCSVTLPHKVAIASLVDDLHESARMVGAVNAVVARDGRLIGHNTNAAGFAEPLPRVDSTAQRPGHLATYLQVIGAGGAARAAIVGGRMAGYSCFELFNRTVERARDLAFSLDLHDAYAGPLDAIAPLEERGGEGAYSHVVVNATVMGMGETASPPVDLRPYPEDTIVYDIVYAPLATPLLQQARAFGLRTIDGLHMLVGQAAIAFELFFGLPAPREHDAELRERLLA